ncbi:MAG TPA: hypothetical protein VLM79_21335 [Kofleriaceae bacterium]|nr:hypothetical protein [Kofleriaceae bacterium]
MTSSPVRLIELCLIAAVCLAQAPGMAAAEVSSDTRDHSYAYLRNGNDITMSGNTKDIARARSFRQGSGPMLWFREGGQEYVVRDPDTLAQLEVVWKPGRELDAAEEKLDRQNDSLDGKRDQLDAKRDELESRRDALADRESDLADRASDDSVTPATKAELEKQRRNLQQQRQALAGELRALERPMKELRAQMDAIQRQLDALRQKQKLASNKEEIEVRALFRRAIAAGTAKVVR